MTKNEAIVVGWIRKGKPADCGETMKNQLMIQKLEELGVHCRQMDFKDWKKHPWVLLQLAWNMMAHRDNTLIFSTSTVNVYPMMKLMKKLGWKQHTVHWVIGGSLGGHVQNGRFDKDVIGYMDWTIVESNLMVEQLTEAGVKNVIQLPNFKPISYYPDIRAKVERRRSKGYPMRFVFLSRIMSEKGCDYILEATKQLNLMGLKDKFIVDFYGAVAPAFKEVFERKVATLSNVEYKGFLNLRENAGYDTLATYDVMLFPTYWKGEGFAGVFIDTYITGVPMIASDWAHNRQFMEEGKTALFIPVHDIPALRDKMKDCIDGKYDLKTMSECCQKEAERYNVDNVIKKDLLLKLGILNND